MTSVKTAVETIQRSKLYGSLWIKGDTSVVVLIVFIMKTCPCNVYPLIPHFHIVKVGYAGVYLFFLFLHQNIDCGYSLEPPRRGGSNAYPQSMF